MAKFKKGNKLAGSRKGIPNRVTKEFKTLVENCFANIGDQAEFDKWAKKHRDFFYTKVWAKLAPLQFTGHVKVDHENEFAGAIEAFARMVAGRRDAIEARRDHLKLIEGTGRRSEDNKVHADLGGVRKT
jgi:hypothetical protein